MRITDDRVIVAQLKMSFRRDRTLTSQFIDLFMLALLSHKTNISSK